MFMNPTIKASGVVYSQLLGAMVMDSIVMVFSYWFAFFTEIRFWDTSGGVETSRLGLYSCLGDSINGADSVSVL
jgi:hypothetical protein